MARLARYVVNAEGGLDPRSWTRTADYILDYNSNSINKEGEKVGGVRVTNCGTDDPAAATLLIEATQAANTRSTKDKTYHLLFSFPPGEKPSLATLHLLEDELVAAIGFADHQRISAVHIDTDHLHVHVAINKVHPTGLQNIEPYYDKRRLMEACERLEIEHGLQRTNHGLGAEHERRQRTRDGERAKATPERIELSPEPTPGERDSRFLRYLRESYALKGTEQPKAKSLNSVRNLSSCRMASLASRAEMLLSSDARARVQQRGENHHDGLRRPRDGNRPTVGERGGIGATATTVEKQSGIQTLATYVATEVAASLTAATSWAQAHAVLGEHGLEIRPRGAGLVIGDRDIPLYVRASECSRDLSMKAMEGRLGPFEPSGEIAPTPKRRYQHKPVHEHPSTSKLFAQFQREQQQRLRERKQKADALRQENEAYYEQLRAWSQRERALIKASVKGPLRRVYSGHLRGRAADARARHREAMKERRQKLFQETSMPSWADWLVHQAEMGNGEALAVLRSKDERQQRLQGDLMTAAKTDRAKHIVMDRLNPRARRDGTISYRTADGGLVLDRKLHVHAQKATAGAALVALSLAAERFEGQHLVVQGTEEFRRDVARLAGLHSIKVLFADPAMEQARRAALDERKGQEVRPAADKGAGSPRVEGTFHKDEAEAWGALEESALSEQEAIASRPQAQASKATHDDDSRKRPSKGLGEVSASAEGTFHKDEAEAWGALEESALSEQEAIASRPQAQASKATQVPASVEAWIEKRNATRDKISSVGYHRAWTSNDAGTATYQGRRRMEDGTEVLLLQRGGEVLVKPSSSRVVAKASRWKLGRTVTLDARGRFIDTSRQVER